ncbi:MAG: hypothetical protein ACLT98_12895 [Eggerthellaceae bacterium]
MSARKCPGGDRYIVADNEELDDDEKRMIHEVLDLGDATAVEAMTPRVGIDRRGRHRNGETGARPHARHQLLTPARLSRRPRRHRGHRALQDLINPLLTAGDRRGRRIRGQ